MKSLNGIFEFSFHLERLRWNLMCPVHILSALIFMSLEMVDFYF